jgi:hypothetical protein
MPRGARPPRGEKQCSSCGLVKPVVRFDAQAKGDGRAAECTECRRRRQVRAGYAACRNRALQKLARRHRGEYQRYREQARRELAPDSAPAHVWAKARARVHSPRCPAAIDPNANSAPSSFVPRIRNGRPRRWRLRQPMRFAAPTARSCASCSAPMLAPSQPARSSPSSSPAARSVSFSSPTLRSIRPSTRPSGQGLAIPSVARRALGGAVAHAAPDQSGAPPWTHGP